jgi:hypothetical protein
MTQAISNAGVSSFATEIAELLIQNETTQADADRAQRDAARATFLADAQKQVDALHAAASATEVGAIVGAAFSTVSGACAIVAADSKFEAETADKCDTFTIAGNMRSASNYQTTSKVLSDLAGPAKAIVGDAPAEHEQATAKHFEPLAEQAKWQADDASAEIDKANTLGGKILDIVQSLNQDQNSAANSVIGRI